MSMTPEEADKAIGDFNTWWSYKPPADTTTVPEDMQWLLKDNPFMPSKSHLVRAIADSTAHAELGEGRIDTMIAYEEKNRMEAHDYLSKSIDSYIKKATIAGSLQMAGGAVGLGAENPFVFLVSIGFFAAGAIVENDARKKDEAIRKLLVHDSDVSRLYDPYPWFKITLDLCRALSWWYLQKDERLHSVATVLSAYLSGCIANKVVKFAEDVRRDFDGTSGSDGKFAVAGGDLTRGKLTNFNKSDHPGSSLSRVADTIMSSSVQATWTSEIGGLWTVDISGGFKYDPENVTASNEDRTDTLSYTITYPDGSEEIFQETVLVLAHNPGLATIDSSDVHEDEINAIVESLKEISDGSDGVVTESILAIMGMSWAGMKSLKLAYKSYQAGRLFCTPRLFRLGYSGLRARFIGYANKARLVNVRSILEGMDIGEDEMFEILRVLSEGEEIESWSSGFLGVLQEFAEEMLAAIVIVAGAVEIALAHDEEKQLREWEDEINKRRAEYNRSVDRFFKG